MDYLQGSERTELIRGEIAKFPAEFGLRAFPGKRFCFCEGDSYLTQTPSFTEGAPPDAVGGESSPSIAIVIYLYTHIFDAERGEWLAFSKGTPAELRREVVALEGEGA